MQSTPIFLEITKVVDFLSKNNYVTRTQGVFHVNYMFFESSLCKI